MKIIGIDPGLRGAIAIMVNGVACAIEDMPVADGSVDPAGLAHILAGGADHAYVEMVNAMPRFNRRKQNGQSEGVSMGATSAFNFGKGYGMVLGVLAALSIPYTLVHSSKWKRAYNLHRDKDESRARALQLFPGMAEHLKRKKDDGRAEALLIAKWGANQ